MPTADELLPWLRQMDVSHVYVNGGPMLQDLQTQLERRLTYCAIVSNGTLALELALRALDLRPRAGVLVPAVTFVASGQAIVNAGLSPVICDVDPKTWQLDAGEAERIVDADDSIAAVMPVAAFGMPVPIRPWERFALRNGRPVLIDAAGALLEQTPSHMPSIAIAFSLHATKAIGAGEGGVVASANRDLVQRVRDMSTFGRGGTNAKMSEYHASAALASLARRAGSWRHEIGRTYSYALPRGVELQLGPFQHSRTLLPVLLPDGVLTAEAVQVELLRAGVETKLWYRPFLDERPEFLNASKWQCEPVSTTAMLRQRLIGLPFHAFMTADDVQHVCSTLTGILR